MGIAEKLWREYANCVFEGIEVSLEQVVETRKAFYAGMFVALQEVFHKKELHAEHLEARLNSFVNELREVLSKQ